MDCIGQLLHLRQGGLTMEEYVHQFCELSYQVPLYDDSLFKDLFYFGLNSHIKAMFNKSFFPGGVYNGSLRGLMDYALLYAGSSFTVGVTEEEGVMPLPLTKMATTLIHHWCRCKQLAYPGLQHCPLRPRSLESPLQSPLRPRSSQSSLSSRSRPALLRLRWSRPALLRLRWSRPALLRLRWSRPARLLRGFCLV